MKNYSKTAKRSLALIISVLMIASACFTGAITALADSTSLADGIDHVATFETGVAGLMNGTQNATNIDGGGITFKSTVVSPAYNPYLHNVDIGKFADPSTGYRLQFANYQSTSTRSDAFGYRMFAIGLSFTNDANSDWAKIFKPNSAGFVFDTVNGTVKLMQGGSTANTYNTIADIIDDDALLYDNFAGKAFTVDFYDAGNGSFVVRVIIDNGDDEDTVLKGEVPYATYNALPGHIGNNGFFTVTGVDHYAGHSTENPANNPWSIEYYGWSNIAPEYAEGLDANATAEDGKYCTNDTLYTATNIEGGVKFRTTYGSYSPYVWKQNMGGYGNGFEAVFSNFVDENTNTESVSYHRFRAYFLNRYTDDNTDSYKWKLNNIGVDVDGVNGKVELVQSTDYSMTAYRVRQELFKGDAFLYENFTGKKFTMKFAPNYDVDGAVTFEMTVGDEKFTTTIQKSLFSDYFADEGAKNIFNASTAYIAFLGTQNGSDNKASVNFYGYRNCAGLPYFAEGLDNYAAKADDKCDKVDPRAWSTDTDYTFGGVNYNCWQLAGYHPYAYGTSVGSIDEGFKLVFANYVSNGSATTKEAGMGQFLLMFNRVGNDSDFYKFKSGAIGVNINTVDGKVEFVQSISEGMDRYVVLQDIITNDAFKYENFQNKYFTYTFTKATSGNIKLTMTVGKNEYSGEITMANWLSVPETVYANGKEYKINSEGTQYICVDDPSAVKLNVRKPRPTTNGATYISFGGTVNNNPCGVSVDFYGVKKGIAPEYAQGIQHMVTSADEKESEVCTDTTARVITDYSFGGIHADFKKVAAYYPFTLEQNVGSYVDGFKLFFNNYVDTSLPDADGHGQFVLILSKENSMDTFTKLKNDVIGVNINTVDGKVELIAGNTAGMQDYIVLATIIENDAFKYENFSGKAFTYTFVQRKESEDIRLIMTVGDKEYTGIIPLGEPGPNGTGWRYYAGSKQRSPDVYSATESEHNAHISFGGIKNVADCKCSVDFFGYSNGFVDTYRTVDDYYTDEQLNALTDFATVEKDISDAASYRTESDRNSGGVALSFTQYSAYGPYRYSTNVQGLYNNGVKFYFSNYVNNNTDHSVVGDGILTLALSCQTANDRTKLKAGVPFLQLDTNAGKLSLWHGDSEDLKTFAFDEDIITDDALKYANLTGKAFTIALRPAGNDFKVVMTVGDKELVGILSGSKLSALTYHPGATVLFTSVGSIDNDGSINNKFSVNFYGYEKLEKEDILPDIDEELYNSLTGKATVADDLMPAASYREVADIAGGGVVITNTNYGAYGPYMYGVNMGRFPGHGLLLQFSDYVNNNTDHSLVGDGMLTVVLSGTSVNDKTKIKPDVPFLLFDTNNGTLKLCKGKQEDLKDYDVIDTIITDSCLEYANFTGKAFSVLFEEDASGDYTVTLTVGSTVKTGTISAATLNAITFHPTFLTTYTSVGSVDNDGLGNSWSVRFYGYKVVKSDLVSDLTGVATKKTNFDNNAYAQRSITDITGGGVNIAYTNLSGYYPYQYSRNVGGITENGLTLKFSNYINNNASTSADTPYGNGILLLTFEKTGVDRASNKFKPGVPSIAINTANGTAKLLKITTAGMQREGVVELQKIIESNQLRYSNFANRDFTVTLKDVNGTYQLIIDVEGKVMTGNIDMAKWNSVEYHPTGTSCYVTVGGIDNIQVAGNTNAWSVNFFGYTNNADKSAPADIAMTPAAIDSAMASVSEISAETAGEFIAIKAAYDALSDDDKALVESADDIASLFADYQQFYEDNSYDAAATFYAGAKAVNESYRTMISSDKADGGFSMNFKGATGYDSRTPLMGSVLKAKYALDGLTLTFNNFQLKAENEGNFFFDFFSGDVNDYWVGKSSQETGHIVVGINPENSEAYLYGCGTTAAMYLGKSDILSKANLSGKKVVLAWYVDANGDYTLAITVGGDTVAFTIGADVVAGATDLDVDALRVAFLAADVDSKFSVDFDSVYANVDDEVYDVMANIALLPETVASDDDAGLIAEINEYYESITAEQKELVYNIDTLTKALAAVRAYNGVDENGMDADGFYVPTMADITEKDNNKYVTSKTLDCGVANGGGIQFNANNGIFGQRQFLNKLFCSEELTLRFSNLKYGQGSFIIGLDGEAGEGGIWNYLGETPRFDIYLAFDNGKIYITKPGLDNYMIEIVDNDAFSPSNLVGKDFFITFDYDVDTPDLDLTFRVGEEVETVNMGSKYARGLDQFAYRYDEAEIIVQSFGGPTASGTAYKSVSNDYSLDLTGIQYKQYSDKQQSAVDKCIADIEALPNTASLSAADAIDAVWVEYNQLGLRKMREGITNFDKLLGLHDSLFSLRNGGSAYNYTATDITFSGIDNSSLLPEYVDDSKVTLDSSLIPDWAENIVMAEVRVRTATEAGTFQAMEPVIKHYAELGVNCLWITPINDCGADTTSDYCNYGPATISPYLTGQIAYGDPYDPSKVDYAAGWQVFEEFIEMAHSYNVRVLIDLVPWGLSKDAPFVGEHAEWFKETSDWGGYDYKLSDATYGTQIRNWYKGEVMSIMQDSACDGIRWDLEPHYLGEDFVLDVLQSLNATGKKPLFISEAERFSTSNAFAFEQCYGVNGNNTGSQTHNAVFFEDQDIVNSVKTGAGLNPDAIGAKLFAYQMSSHDCLKYSNVSQASWAYEFIFSSFIPLFYTGEEWNAQLVRGTHYGTVIDWTELDNAENRAYYENVKKLIQLRWQYKDILANTAEDHRDTNICSIDVLGTDNVKGYARYAGNEAIVVVPNVNANGEAAQFTVGLNLADMNLTGYSYYTVTDMITGDLIVAGSASDIAKVSQTIEPDTAAVYLVSGSNDNAFTWGICADGETLTVFGDGALTVAPWLPAATNVKKVIVAEGVTAIPAGAFENFMALDTVVLTADVDTIGADAFKNTDENLKIVAPQGAYALEYAEGNFDTAYSEIKNTSTDITLKYADGSEIANNIVLNVETAESSATAEIFGSLDAVMYDITMFDGEKNIQPTGAVTVSIPVPDTMDAANVVVYYVDSDGATTKMDAVCVDNNMEFNTTHFSNYALVELSDFEGDFDIDSAYVSNGTVNVRVDKTLADVFTDLSVEFTQGGASTTIDEYTIEGNNAVFTYTVPSSGDVTAVLSGTYITGKEFTSDAFVINEDYLDTTYVVYNKLPGDVNGDGLTNIKDLLRVKKALAEESTEAINDVNGDAAVTIADADALAKIILKGKKGIEAYTVTFKDSLGNTIDTQVVTCGFSAVAPKAPARPGYSFDGWDVDFTNITADTVVTATYTANGDPAFDGNEGDDIGGTVPEDWGYDA